ncbi:MAG: sulfatase-like hydrolase/transferase [Verrucomicrobiales bacterium]|nr:sulfatase-like hydrolase/transferase [Verrucomicrobiales bacterium]
MQPPTTSRRPAAPPAVLALLVFLLLIAPGDARPAAAPARPNIVVLLCDDLGYGDLECYGHPRIMTPNLNRLAADGIRFTDCYSAAPVCSPSRVGLLTGRSPNRAGVYDWIPSASTPRPDAREQVHLRAGEFTLPRLLKDAGYATCMAGKWHCNSRFNQPEQPQPGDFGFDHWLATQNNAGPSHENPRNFVRNGDRVGPLAGFSCQLVVDEAIHWLERQPNPGPPFFLYVAFHEPHEPVASPPDLVAQYRPLARTDDEAQFFANVANVDQAVGRLLRALDESGRRDNTLIVFTSDNGPETLDRYRGANRSYGRPGPLRGMKLHTHDGGFRVAGILNWKGRVAPAQIVRTPVSSLDLLPTFAALAGAGVPSGRVLDGTDLRPLLEGRPLIRHQPLVWAYYNALNEARVAMRDGRWKVLAQLDHGEVARFENLTPETLPIVRDAALTDLEIYDAEADPGEAANLAETRPELARELAAKLAARYRELAGNSPVWTPGVPPDSR